MLLLLLLLFLFQQPRVLLATAPQQQRHLQLQPFTRSLSIHHFGDAAATIAATVRADYVRDLLIRRLNYVRSGKRMDEVTRWYKRKQQLPSSDNDNAHARFRRASNQTPFPSHIERLDFGDDTSLQLIQLSRQENPMQEASSVDVWKRAVRLGLCLSPALSTIGLAALSSSFRRKYWYRWLTNSLGRTGGAAFIKWGQWSSVRSDIFPEHLCNELATLQADAPAHSLQHTREILERSLGLAQGTLYMVLDELDEEPIASGSIAQVYRAKLGGETIAIKVMHPDVDRLMHLDFRIMSNLGEFVERYVPSMAWLNLGETIQQFSYQLHAQTNLQVEANHLERLNYNFRTWPSVRFPEPFFATPSVILETFEPGQGLVKVAQEFVQLAGTVQQNKTNPESDTETMTNKPAASELIPVDMSGFVVTCGHSLYLKMLLIDKLMHADLHPGNILLNNKAGRITIGSTAVPSTSIFGQKQQEQQQCRRQGDKETRNKNNSGKKYNFCLVDAGLVTPLTGEEGAIFIGILSSVGRGDGAEAAKFALQFASSSARDESNDDESDHKTGGRTSCLSTAQRENFVRDMKELFQERVRGYGTNADLGSILRAILQLIRRHQVRINGIYATLIVNLLCIEGIGRMYLPQYNVLDHSEPLLETYRRLCYTKDGTPKKRRPESKFVRIWLGLMYCRKVVNDRLFLWKEKRLQRRRKELTEYRSMD